MTEYAVTRLGRVVQQLRSFSELHASELEALASELDAAEQQQLAARVRAFRDIQRDEALLVLEEVQDIQNGLAPREEEEHAAQAGWEASPKRAQWLSRQAAPRTRRDVLRGSRASDE
jgi:hypothetical protein